MRPLLKAVRRVAGVRAVSDQLTVYNEPGNVSALQGGEPRSGERFELLQENWSPAARVLVGGVGAALMLAATQARGGLCALLGVSGGALVARAASNRDLASLLGFGSRGITVQKTIYVAAPIERVFDFWTDYQNFPRFMHNVRDVRQLRREPLALGGRRSRRRPGAVDRGSHARDPGRAHRVALDQRFRRAP